MISFRPMPGLTVIVLIMSAILISLGTWQYHRLQWKTDLLAEIEEAAEASPFTSLSEVVSALEAGEPVDFRRIGLTVEVTEGERFHVFTAADRQIGWRVFVPVMAGGRTVFADLSTRPDAQKNNSAAYGTDPFPLTGYIRLARPALRGAAKNTPDANRWFGFNPLPDRYNWADRVPGGAEVRFYIDAETSADAVTSASNLPVRRPDIANNHFDYMLTWYGLAVTLWVFYVLIHKRAGRLSW